MPDLDTEQKIIAGFLSDAGMRNFIVANLKESLASVGFSQKLIAELTDTLCEIDIKKFQDTFSIELENVYRIGFFQKIVPTYFEKFVFPEIPAGKILDIGCGTGVLIKKLAESGTFNGLAGIDIDEYPEWNSFDSPGVRFEVVSEDRLPEFLNEYRPDSIVLTWTLHHMEYEEQGRYLQNFFQLIKPGSNIIILEDSYSKKLLPENGKARWEGFMIWSENDRKKIMSVHDWIANRILARRMNEPIPFSFRVMEDWIDLFEQCGFKLKSKKFIGFPDHRDINTPQSILVFYK